MLLDQFYVSLRATQAAIHSKSDGSVLDQKIDDQISILFRQNKSWQVAYEIEQMQCLLMSGALLDTELDRRLAEAESLKIDVATLRKKVEDKGTTEPLKRAALRHAVNEIQSRSTKKYQRSQAARQLTRRVSTLFFLGFVTLTLTLIVQLSKLNPVTPQAGTSTEAAQKESK